MSQTEERKYGVWSYHKPGHPDDKTEYFVTDRLKSDSHELAEHRTVATFPVTGKFSADEQRKRAIEYADYMNKILEATKTAQEQNQLVNILKT